MAVSPAPTAQGLMRNSETAMYSAKAAGRKRVRRFDRTLAVHADERYALSADLRVALADDSLEMHYQPLVDLGTGHVVGMEALARWHHPRLGTVPPDRFVTIAEETGLAPDLDRWVLRRTLEEFAALRSDGAVPDDAYVAVNLSARTLGDTQLEATVSDQTAVNRLCPSDVVLEITESAIMDNPETAIDLLGRLRRRGFQVALDDFGTGHSSLNYLRELPITKLKIDRSFVAEIVENRNARAIVTSIIELARAIDVSLVAEGVETPEQARLLRDMGCTTAQGWLWSPAVAPAVARETRALVRRYGQLPIV